MSHWGSEPHLVLYCTLPLFFLTHRTVTLGHLTVENNWQGNKYEAIEADERNYNQLWEWESPLELTECSRGASINGQCPGNISDPQKCSQQLSSSQQWRPWTAMTGSSLNMERWLPRSGLQLLMNTEGIILQNLGSTLSEWCVHYTQWWLDECREHVCNIHRNEKRDDNSAASWASHLSSWGRGSQ